MYERVSAEALGERERIAGRVRDELAAAGLPIAPGDYVAEGDVNHGVLVQVDGGDDAAGGVIIEWECRRGLREAAMDAVANHRFDDPAIWHNGAVAQAMNTAITAILASAGFTVVENPDDMNPLTLKVQAAPDPNTPSAWERASDAASPGVPES